MWRNVMVWFVIAGMVNFLLPAHLFAGGEQVGTQKFVEPYAMTLEEGQQTHQALEGMQAKALAINGQQPGAAAARVLPPPAPRPGPAVRKPPVHPGKSRFLIGVTPPPYITISKPVVPWILEGFPVDGGGLALEILIKNHPELEELLGGPPATPEEPQVPPLASVEAPTPKPPVHPGGSRFVISRLLRTVMIEGNGSPSTPPQEVLDSPEQVQEVNEQDSQEGPADGSFFRSSFWGIRLGEAAGPESFKHWSLRVIFGLYPDEEDDPTHDTAI